MTDAAGSRDDGDGRDERVELGVGLPAHRRVGLGAEVLDDHLLHVAVPGMAPGDGDERLDAVATARAWFAPGEIAVGVVIGRASEYFDFFVYGIASALIFPSIFFPFLDRLEGTLAAFAVFALAFIARPFGTVLFMKIQSRWGLGVKLTSALFLLGTDELGRDLLSRLIHGARLSLVIGLASVVLSLIPGILLGLAAGFFPRLLGPGIMRLMDIMLALPSLLLAVAIVVVRPEISVPAVSEFAGRTDGPLPQEPGTVLEVEPDDRYLRHVLKVHAADIARYAEDDPHFWQVAPLLRRLADTGGRYGLETMCVGGGQGMAMVLERVA